MYPPCGCDPATTALARLDLLAEATVAARFGGERERALKITKMALRLLEEDQDPLRAAWFWAERSSLVMRPRPGRRVGGARQGAGARPGTAPSHVHAQVLVRAAGWGMLHNPGPGNLEAAERAVEYAHMVGAEEIELNARITMGSLLADSGERDRGLAVMAEVKERATARGYFMLAGRAHINLSSQLESLGRSAEAVELAQQGVELVGRARMLDIQAWMFGNMAESLYSLGRWDEAAEAARRTLRVGQSAAPRGSGAARLAYLALARGELSETATQLAAAHAHFGTHDTQPQHRIPLYRLAVGLAAGRAGSPTCAPRSPRRSPRASRSATTVTPGRCSSPRPPRKPTPGACPPPTPAATPPWTPCAQPPGTWPPRCRCGPPTPSTSAPSCAGPKARTPSATGPRSCRRSPRWTAPTCWPAPATGSPRPGWRPAATANGPRAWSGTPTPPPSGWAPAGFE